MSVNRWLDHIKQTRHRDSRGAALVEAALVMVPLCLLIFAILEFGLLFKDYLSVSNATRAGARTGVAEPLKDGMPGHDMLDDVVASVTRQGIGASLSTGDWLCLYEVRKSADGSIFPDGKPPTDCVGGHAQKWSYSNGQWRTGQSYDIWAQFTPEGGDTAQAGPDVCLGDPKFDSLGVALHVTHHSVTGFFGQVTLNQHTVMRLEPQKSKADCVA